MNNEQQIMYIRKFNRDYTAKIGILEKHILNSDYSLAESRIMLEIKEISDCTSKAISSNLGLDAGFVSRTISSLIKRDMIVKTNSKEDKRAFILKLTEKAVKVLDELDAKSNEQIGELLADLTEKEINKTYESIKYLNRYLLKDELEIPGYIMIRNDLKAGDAGRLIALHGEIYQKECGYNKTFEGYVCKTFYEVLVNGSKEKDKFWIAELNGEIIGSIAIIDKGNRICQLRWLLVLPEFRKTGLGKKLIYEAMEYAKSGTFDKIFLETSNEQTTAIHLYEKEGFEIKRTYDINDWGKPLSGIYMEKNLL